MILIKVLLQNQP